MKRPKYPLSTTHSVKILKHIAGSTTRNAFLKFLHCGLYNPQYILKKILYFYIAGCTTRNTFKKNFVTRNAFINCFVLRVVQPAICYGVVVITLVLRSKGFQFDPRQGHKFL